LLPEKANREDLKMRNSKFLHYAGVVAQSNWFWFGVTAISLVLGLFGIWPGAKRGNHVGIVFAGIAGVIWFAAKRPIREP
jgi:hypothetical protein